MQLIFIYMKKSHIAVLSKGSSCFLHHWLIHACNHEGSHLSGQVMNTTALLRRSNKHTLPRATVNTKHTPKYTQETTQITASNTRTNTCAFIILMMEDFHPLEGRFRWFHYPTFFNTKYSRNSFSPKNML